MAAGVLLTLLLLCRGQNIITSRINSVSPVTDEPIDRYLLDDDVAVAGLRVARLARVFRFFAGGNMLAGSWSDIIRSPSIFCFIVKLLCWLLYTKYKISQVP